MYDREATADKLAKVLWEVEMYPAITALYGITSEETWR